MAKRSFATELNPVVNYTDQLSPMPTARLVTGEADWIRLSLVLQPNYSIGHLKLRPLFQWVTVSASLMATVPAFSGPFEDGIAARDRGDFAAAFNAFKPLASAGDSNSQFQLSLLYSGGKGVNRNTREAMRWLKQAAVRGNVQAQSNLGNAFNAGHEVPQDVLKAYAWLSIAATRGNSVATTNRDIVARKLIPQQIDQANTLIRQCLAGDYRPCL